MPSTDRLIAAALLAPLGLVMLCLVTVAAVEGAGGTAFGAMPPRNLAEAAAIGRADDVVRRLRLGEDRDRVYDLRPEAISSAVLKATPIEAAMWSRQRQMIVLLDHEGAIRSAEQRRELACLAADLELGDIVEYLSTDAALQCRSGEIRDRVLARTPGN